MPNSRARGRISIDGRFQHPTAAIAREQLLPATAPEDRSPIAATHSRIEDAADWSNDPELPRYLTPLIETKNGRPICTIAFPPATSRELYADSGRFAADALRALGLSDGVFHLEVFGEPGGFIAGELAARPGGGWIPLLVRTVIGVDLCRAGVQLAVGDEITVGDGTDEVHGHTHLPADPGRVNRLTARHITAVPGVIRVQFDVPTGEPTPDMRRSSRTRLGLAMVKAPDRPTCEAILRDVIATVRRVNVPG